MQHLDELKRRLQQSDRRVFAFLHPSLPGQPLVVLHTAIMDNIPATMAAVLVQSQQNGLAATGATPGKTRSVCPGLGVLEHLNADSRRPPDSIGSSDQGSGNDPRNDDGDAGSGGQEAACVPGTAAPAGHVACFYSISSSQPGLSGVDLGNFLIKRAVQLLLSELPQLQHLVTLSPLPGFRSWLITKLQQQLQHASRVDDSIEQQQICLLTGEVQTVNKLCQLVHSAEQQAAVVKQYSDGSSTGSDEGGGDAVAEQTTTAAAAAAAATATAGLLQLVQQHSWLKLSDHQQQELQPVLVRLCALYLLTQKRRRFALDPVAHFHLKNGAWLWRINCRCDQQLLLVLKGMDCGWLRQ
jgi:hypothetical protein